MMIYHMENQFLLQPDRNYKVQSTYDFHNCVHKQIFDYDLQTMA